MKSAKIGLVIVALFSIFLITYFNSFSIAQENTKEDLKVDSEVYKQLENNKKVIVIIDLKDNIATEDIDKIIKNSKNNIDDLTQEIKSQSGNIKIVQNYEALNSLAVEVDQTTLELLKNSELVEKIFAEVTLEIQMQQSMPLINATQAWNYQVTPTTNLTGVGQIVCLLDTGVDYTHPALGGAWGTKIIAGYDFVNNDTNPMDDHGHGTHLAGIIAANFVNSTTTIKGVAPDAKIIAEKVCGSNGGCSNTNMVAGLNHCLTIVNPKKLSVVSISIGDLQSHTASTCPIWMDTGINTAVANGVPVVVSSGNQGFKNGISYPACSPNATSVGMTYDANHSALGGMNWVLPNSTCTDGVNATVDKVACASNSGSNLDLMAPGAKITSTRSSVGPITQAACGGGGPTLTFTCSGTSQSAAHVSGAVALIKQKYRMTAQPNSNWRTVMKIEYFLKNSPITVTDPGNSLSFPRLSLERFI